MDLNNVPGMRLISMNIITVKQDHCDSQNGVHSLILSMVPTTRTWVLK